MNIKKTRHLSKKDKFEKGMYPFSITLKKYSVGQKVIIKLRPIDLKRRPSRIFNGKIGFIKNINPKTNTYIVLAKQSEHSTIKQIITSSCHLKSTC